MQLTIDFVATLTCLKIELSRNLRVLRIGRVRDGHFQQKSNGPGAVCVSELCAGFGITRFEFLAQL
jgi:hypothetical protein